MSNGIIKRFTYDIRLICIHFFREQRPKFRIDIPVFQISYFLENSFGIQNKRTAFYLVIPFITLRILQDPADLRYSWRKKSSTFLLTQQHDGSMGNLSFDSYFCFVQESYVIPLFHFQSFFPVFGSIQFPGFPNGQRVKILNCGIFHKLGTPIRLGYLPLKQFMVQKLGHDGCTAFNPSIGLSIKQIRFSVKLVKKVNCYNLT